MKVLTVLRQALISSDVCPTAISRFGVAARCALPSQPGTILVLSSVGLISPSHERAPRAGSDLQSGQGHVPAPSVELIVGQALLFDIVGA